MKLLLAVVLACAVVALARGPFVYSGVRSLIGQPVKGPGSLRGQCATLCQVTCPGGMPLTRDWRRGIKVQGNANRIAVGTVIATFMNLRSNPSNPYNKNGQRHTAYYLGQDGNGVQVVHQYSRLTRIEQYTLRWSSCSPHMCGGAYYVVMSGVPNLSDAEAAGSGSPSSTPPRSPPRYSPPSYSPPRTPSYSPPRYSPPRYSPPSYSPPRGGFFGSLFGGGRSPSSSPSSGGFFSSIFGGGRSRSPSSSPRSGGFFGSIFGGSRSRSAASTPMATAVVGAIVAGVVALL